MLSSLVPGAIFQTSGLNRKSTPTPPNVTPSQLEHRYKRDSFNGVQWPHDSPVSRVYDVANTSTSLIILNNKYGKGSTRLRGYYTGPNNTDRYIDPNRHRAKSPRNPDHHYRCLDSSTPRFEPAIHTGLEWTSTVNRPPSSLIGERLHESKSSVNPRRHQACQSRQNLSATPITTERPRSRMSLPPQRYFTDYSDMSLGETLYMWSIEKIYNVENLKHLKQEQYRKLLQLEAKKGHHDFPEYAKYLRYINNAPNRTYGTGTGTPRSKSAFSNRTTSGRTSPTKYAEPKTETKAEKETTSGTAEETEPQKRPQTSVPTTQREDKNEQKQEPLKPTPSKEDKPKPDKTTQGQGSRSPSRSSRSSQQKLGSMRSLRSKGSSKPSSRTSSAKSSQSRNAVNRMERLEHHEGGDRPKSRAGRLSDDGPSKSKENESNKTQNVDRQTDKHDEPNSLSSSTISLDNQDKMGSTSSISSKSSDNTLDTKQDSTAKNATDDVKVHRIPSAVELKDELEEEDSTGIDVKEDSQTKHAELGNDSDKQVKGSETKQAELGNDSDKQQKDIKTKQADLDDDIDKQPKEVEKTVKFSDVDNDLANKTDEEKTEVKDVSDNMNKSDDMKEFESKEETKIESNKGRLSRQDSFDEDDDRRRNRDLDQIEY